MLRFSITDSCGIVINTIIVDYNKHEFKILEDKLKSLPILSGMTVSLWIDTCYHDDVYFNSLFINRHIDNFGVEKNIFITGVLSKDNTNVIYYQD